MAASALVASSCSLLSPCTLTSQRQGVVSASFGRKVVCPQKPARLVWSSQASEIHVSNRRCHRLRVSQQEDTNPAGSQETVSTSKPSVDETPSGPPLLTIFAGFFVIAVGIWVFVALLKGVYGLVTWAIGPASMVK